MQEAKDIIKESLAINFLEIKPKNKEIRKRASLHIISQYYEIFTKRSCYLKYGKSIDLSGEETQLLGRYLIAFKITRRVCPARGVNFL